MTAVLVGRFEPGSDEWHAARANGLGGSEIAPVLGLSPFESRFSLWHRKAGRLGPVEETEIMETGKRLEPAIIQRFIDDHPELSPAPSATFSHSDRPWQIANPDLLLGDRIMEAKFALYPDGWGEPGTDKIPLHYKCQVQWYMDVLGLDICYVMVFIGSQGRFVEYVVRADHRGQQFMRDAAEKFLASIAANDRPTIDAHDSTYEAVREMHPLIEPRKVEVSATIAIPYGRAKAAEAAAKAVAQQATAALADVMGNAKTATYNGFTIAGRQARGTNAPYIVAARNLAASDFYTELKEAS